MVSFGLLGYDMSRSQSMLRVATTASPISGSEVRERILALKEEETLQWATRHIQRSLRFVQILRQATRREHLNSPGKILSKMIKSADSLDAPQTGSAHAAAIFAAEMVAVLPQHYLWSTTDEERQVHVKLFQQYKETVESEGSRYLGDGIVLSWTMQKNKTTILLCVIFLDAFGSLSAITRGLSSMGVEVQRTAAFCTRGGVAVDSFVLSSNFDQPKADELRKQLNEHLISELRGGKDSEIQTLVSELSKQYVQSTTLADRHMSC